MYEETNNDQLILEKLRLGDKSSFEMLYSKYSGRLYNFVLQLSRGDFYLAEEIVQNVFLKIWEIHPQIQPESSFNSFVFTIGKNMFLNVVKSRIYESQFKESIKQDFPADYSLEKEIEFKLLEEHINDLIDRLPPARRKVYILSRIKHMSNKEIAVLLDISENTVESQLYKSTQFMRRHLTPYLELIALVLLTNSFMG